MAVSSENRKAGPYTGNGSQTAFPFSFKLFKPSHIEVRISDVGAAVDEAMDKSLYTVALNVNQDNTPGGVLTLNSPLPNGKVITLLSASPFIQETVFTNQGGFYPEVLNKSLDQLTILTQQLKELAMRHLTVPSTSNKTPQQVMQEILDIAATANTYAAEAKKIYDQVVLVDQNVAANAQSVSLMKASVDTSEQNVTALAAQVNEYSDELMLVADNLTDIDAIGTNITAIQAVSNDLRSLPVHRYDCGPISEPLTPANGIGGVLQICAENIDIIRQVAESLENATELTSLAEVVSEIGSTDYTAINNTGNTGA